MISNDTFALVENSALLACVGFGVPSVEITWSLNGTSIMNSSIVTISEEEITGGGKVFKQSFLELCSLSISDSGVYSCSVSNGLTMVNETTQLSVAGNCRNILHSLMIRPGPGWLLRHGRMSTIVYEMWLASFHVESKALGC